ncbi:MAG TPA: ATP-binding protein [Candidatus Saccharimonadia bacterium]|nr:ATP-binding protein [Candidatus Saccharimonadia bacterium]
MQHLRATTGRGAAMKRAPGNRLRLRTRLVIAYGAVLLVALAAIATAVFTTVDNARASAEAVRVSSEGIRNSNRVWKLLGDLGTELFERSVTGQYDARNIARIEREVREALAAARGLSGGQRSEPLIARVAADFDALVDAYQRIGPEAGLDPALPLLLARARDGSIEMTHASLGVLDESTRVAHARASKVALLLGATTGVILLIGIWVSIRIARSMTDPLDAMVEGARRYAGGAFDYRVPESGVHEVDALGERFNWMAEALERLRATDIERVVREQRRNETVLESIDDGLVILDAHARVQRANPVALRQIGEAREVVAGRPLQDLLPDPGLRAHIESALAASGRDVLAGEFALDVSDSPRRVGYSLVPFHDGTDPGLVLVLRDVTEQRAFEALRTQFVLRASHELRTPLTGLRMAFDLLDRKFPVQPGSREAELLVTIKQELARLAQLITDLVDLSRLYAETTEVDLADVRVAELVDAARARHAERIAQTGVTLAVDDQCPDCVVRADRAHLDRVFDSLLDNALRASPGGGTIELRARRYGGEARFEIHDQGAGIPLGLQARIFEPFTQFGSPGTGAGLGLSLSREIVARHRGRIELHSEPGQGACFSFAIPLA